MNKRLKNIVLLVMLSLLFYEVHAEERFTDNNIGISFKVPTGTLKSNTKLDNYDNKYFYNVIYTTFEELKKEKLNDYRIEIKEYWELKDFFEEVKTENNLLIASSNDSYRKHFFGKDIIGESSFGYPYPCRDASFGINILYKDKIISIWLTYNDFKRSIPQRYTNYFNGEFVEGTYWCDFKDRDAEKAFYKLIESKDKKAPIELLKLQEYFNEIVNSLQFFEPTAKDTKQVQKLTLTIENLRFRETPTLDGKFIRLLVKGEKLEVLERGKTEEVSGTKGTWVKVKTEKGEIGWAFSGYLEEIK